MFVIFLKAQVDGKDEYNEIVSANGFTVATIKTLDFEYKNLDLFLDELKHPERFSGIIFTSPRCVNATKLALAGEAVDERWNSLDNYVVGEATSQLALVDLGLKSRGKESGNANNLAVIMLQEKHKYSKPFLLPHGNLKMDILKTCLADEINLTEVYVYDTVSNEKIYEEFESATDNFINNPDYLVFFSPSGVKAAKCILEKMASVKFIAIGPTTATAMKENNLPVYGTAVQPTAKCVLDVLLK